MEETNTNPLSQYGGGSNTKGTEREECRRTLTRSLIKNVDRLNCTSETKLTECAYIKPNLDKFQFDSRIVSDFSVSQSQKEIAAKSETLQQKINEVDQVEQSLNSTQVLPQFVTKQVEGDKQQSPAPIPKLDPPKIYSSQKKDNSNEKCAYEPIRVFQPQSGDLLERGYFNTIQHQHHSVYRPQHYEIIQPRYYEPVHTFGSNSFRPTETQSLPIMKPSFDTVIPLENKETKTPAQTLKAKVSNLQIQQQQTQACIEAQNSPSRDVFSKSQKQIQSTNRSVSSADLHPKKVKKPSINLITNRKKSGKSATKVETYKSLRCLKPEKLPNLPELPKSRSRSKSKSKSRQQIISTTTLSSVQHDDLAFLNQIINLAKEGMRRRDLIGPLQQLYSQVRHRQTDNQTQLRTQKKKVKHLSSIVEDQAQTLKMADERLQLTQKEVKDIKALNSDLLHQLQSAESQLRRSTDLLPNASHQSLLDEQIRSQLEQAEKLNREIQYLKDYQNSLQSANSMLTQQLKESSNALENMQQKCRAFELQLAQQTKALEQAHEQIAKVNNQKDQESIRYRNKLCEFQAKEETLKQNLESLKEALDRKFEISSIEPGQCEPIQKRLEEEIQALKLQLKQKDVEIDEIQQAAKNKLKKQKKQMNAEISKIQSRFDQLSQKQEAQQMKELEQKSVDDLQSLPDLYNSFQDSKQNFCQQLRTKEEEIQMLWRVVKTQNSQSDYPHNLKLLESIMLRNKENQLIS